MRETRSLACMCVGGGGVGASPAAAEASRTSPCSPGGPCINLTRLRAALVCSRGCGLFAKRMQQCRRRAASVQHGKRCAGGCSGPPQLASKGEKRAGKLESKPPLDCCPPGSLPRAVSQLPPRRRRLEYVLTGISSLIRGSWRVASRPAKHGSWRIGRSARRWAGHPRALLAAGGRCQAAGLWPWRTAQSTRPRLYPRPRHSSVSQPARLARHRAAPCLARPLPHAARSRGQV